MESKMDISVIIPMFNAEKYIEGTINSIFQQEVHHFSVEVIIIDDKSIDNSCEIVKKTQSPPNNVNSTESKWRDNICQKCWYKCSKWGMDLIS